MGKRPLIFVVGLTVIALAGCGEGEESPEAQAERMAAARADSVAMAESRYDPAVYDTIRWEDPNGRLQRGGTVWQFSCQKCHGRTGHGGGEFALQEQIAVPSLMKPDWEYAGDIEAIRHRIFVGHEGEMPNWGLHGLRYRDIDAVAHYIEERLRAEADL